MRKLLIFCLLLLAACKLHPDKTIHVQPASDGTLICSGIEYQAIAQVAEDSTAMVWENVISVSKMPADTDLKSDQPIQPGKYVIKGRDIVFTPDTPFVKGQKYFARCYDLSNEDALSAVKNRGRFGEPTYIDLIFRY